MNMDKNTYRRYAEARAPRSPLVKDCARAFFVGGGICLFAQGIKDVYLGLCGLEEETAATLTSVTLILLAVVLTGVGVFDRIARFAGAGTLLPVTGFANAVASPAMDNKSEGYVMGVGAKMFIVAGPVIVYGTAAAVLYGLVYFIVGRLL